MQKRVRQIPLSPLKTPNELENNELGDIRINTGTQSCQSSISLYDTLAELCKEKKMRFFKPTPYVEYLPPKLTEGKEWYVHYSVINPATGKMVRYRNKVNRPKTVKERRQIAKLMIASISEKLALGWNPILEKEAPKSYHTLIEAMDTFLKVKTKETEENSLRSYKSYIKILKNWLTENNYPQDLYVAQFNEPAALDFMDAVEDDDRLSARTYNNYRSFYVLLWNWFIEKKYASTNPFSNIKKKPKKLTKKIRRTLDDTELKTLFTFLEKENPNYLAMCLLCYCCFMRPKEIALLQCSDIDLTNQIIHVSDKIAKNDNESYRTIPDAMMPYLECLDLSDRGSYLFSTFKEFKPGKKKICSREIARYWNDVVRTNCGFDMDIQFYSLKDTGITNMTSLGIPLNFVKQQADHSSLAMTAIYMGNTTAKATQELKTVNILPK